MRLQLKNTINVDKIISKIQAQHRKALFEIGKELAGGRSGYIQREMTKKPKSGKVYMVSIGIGGRKLLRPRRHIASTKNEFPAVISGALRESTGFKIISHNKLIIGSGANHSVALNKRNKYLQKTVNNNLQRIRKPFKKLIKI